MANTFVWYELMTTDLDAAHAFYAGVVGWRGEEYPSANRYIVMKAGDANAAGLMTLPEHVRQGGGRPSWIGYIGVADVEAAAGSLAKAGGQVHRAPDDIPEIGRFAVVSDPQGAVFTLFQPQGGSYTPPPPMTPGHVGWHELYATDWKAAFDFYSGQFGWTKGEAMDMGPVGVYQLFAAGNGDIGGMMNKPSAFPMPYWGFYFNVVDGIDAAASRVTAGGGSIMMGPHQVPGGTWIVQCADPQGASFALTSPNK